MNYLEYHVGASCSECGAKLYDPAGRFCSQCGVSLFDDIDDDEPEGDIEDGNGLDDNEALPLPLGSPDVQELVARGRHRQAIKLYQREEGLSKEEAEEAIGVLTLMVRLDARGMKRAFYDLGDMAGMTMRAIYSAAGPPVSASQAGEGRLLQWQRSGFSIAITFSADGYFQGVTSQYG